MTTSRRLADRKVEKFEKNIKKRGAVPESSTKKGSNLAVGPVLLGFFVFVVIGSCKAFEISKNISTSYLDHLPPICLLWSDNQYAILPSLCYFILLTTFPILCTKLRLNIVFLVPRDW